MALLPSQKVAAGGVAGSITAIGIWMLSEFAGVTFPVGIEAEIAVLVGFVVAYFTPKGEVTDEASN